MEVTLRPDHDDAARTALFVYARLTEDEELRANLERVYPPEHRFDSLIGGADIGANAYRILRALSSPNGTIETIESTLERLGLEPVTLVCRRTQAVSTDEGVEVGAVGR